MEVEGDIEGTVEYVCKYTHTYMYIIITCEVLTNYLGISSFWIVLIMEKILPNLNQHAYYVCTCPDCSVRLVIELIRHKDQEVDIHGCGVIVGVRNGERSCPDKRITSGSCWDILLELKEFTRCREPVRYFKGADHSTTSIRQTGGYFKVCHSVSMLHGEFIHFGICASKRSNNG